MSDIVIEKMNGGKSSVRIYIRKPFFDAQHAAIAEIAPNHDANKTLDFPGDRPGYRVAQYHVPTHNEEAFTGAVRRVTSNNQLQHNQL